MTEANESEFLELREVNVARGERVVLYDVNLTIRTGEHGHRGDELFRRQRDADDAGGGRKDFLRSAPKDFSGGCAGGACGGQARFAGGTVGVAGVDGDHAD